MVNIFTLADITLFKSRINSDPLSFQLCCLTHSGRVSRVREGPQESWVVAPLTVPILTSSGLPDIWPDCSYCKISLDNLYYIRECKQNFEHSMQIYVNFVDAYAIMSPQNFQRKMVTLQNVSVGSDNVCCNW